MRLRLGSVSEVTTTIWKKFEGPWGEAHYLGCRDLLCGQRLVLDLFEYQQSSPGEEVKIGGEIVPDSHMIGLTESSRIWRISFDRPFALRVRDRNISGREPDKLKPPAPCSFAEDSEWIREFYLEKVDFIPTHYIFALLDDHIEILGSDQPQIETIQNDLTGEDSALAE